MQARMLGKQGRPFCGDHCCPYPQGSGKINKRILKRTNKARERREVQQEVVVQE